MLCLRNISLSNKSFGCILTSLATKQPTTPITMAVKFFTRSKCFSFHQKGSNKMKHITFMNSNLTNTNNSHIQKSLFRLNAAGRANRRLGVTERNNGLASLLRRVYNTESSVNKTAQPQTTNTAGNQQAGSLSIFARFKSSYKQHGKVLIYCHFVLCCGWITAFYFLSKFGFDLQSLLSILEKLHIFSKETSASIIHKINTFNLDKFLRDSYFSYVMPDALIRWLGVHVTGETLKHTITAVFIYKIFTPVRYAATIAVTQLVIKLFKRRGIIPIQPPPGSSIKDLYAEQKQKIRRGIKSQKEKYKNTRVGRYYYAMKKPSLSMYNRYAKKK